MTALLLIAHGSRRAEANADLDFIADGLRARGRFDLVATSYLELAEPTITAAAATCVTAGATDVILMPYFLSPGVHVVDDLQATLQQLQLSHPAVRFRLAEPLGRHPLLIDIVSQRAECVS